MAFIPKAITSLITDDPVLSRVSQNVRQAVQPTLDFLNTNFTQNTDGALRLLRNTVAQGSLTALQQFIGQAGAQFYGDVSVNGNVYAKARSVNAFVLQPAVTGVVAYITNIAGNSAQLIFYSDGGLSSVGQIGGANVVSGAGFKAIVKMGQYYHTNYPGGQKNTVDPLYNLNTGTMATKVARWVAPRAGSVTGITVDNETPVNATCDVGVAVNGSTIVYPRLMAASAGKGSQTYAKGAVAFNAGDALTCLCGFGASGISPAISVNFEVELGA